MLKLFKPAVRAPPMTLIVGKSLEVVMPWLKLFNLARLASGVIVEWLFQMIAAPILLIAAASVMRRKRRPSRGGGIMLRGSRWLRPPLVATVRSLERLLSNCLYV